MVSPPQSRIAQFDNDRMTTIKMNPPIPKRPTPMSLAIQSTRSSSSERSGCARFAHRTMTTGRRTANTAPATIINGTNASAICRKEPPQLLRNLGYVPSVPKFPDNCGGRQTCWPRPYRNHGDGKKIKHETPPGPEIRGQGTLGEMMFSEQSGYVPSVPEFLSRISLTRRPTHFPCWKNKSERSILLN